MKVGHKIDKERTEEESAAVDFEGGRRGVEWRTGVLDAKVALFD